MKCQARQYSDQKVCSVCGLQWDMNDPEPPECRGFRGYAEPVTTDGKYRVAIAKPTAPYPENVQSKEKDA